MSKGAHEEARGAERGAKGTSPRTVTGTRPSARRAGPTAAFAFLPAWSVPLDLSSALRFPESAMGGLLQHRQQEGGSALRPHTSDAAIERELRT